MIRKRLFARTGFAVCAAAAGLTMASAQPPKTQPPKTRASKKPAEETVTVKAERPAVQILPDRTVYSLDKNIQASTSSLSDVLRNLPAVDVDIQGNVSLHGDSHVTILINGKKSPLLAGNQADALQQIPADMVDRVEVITNPSAEFRAEGSGGIINIILKKNKQQTASGIVHLNVGNEGRLNGSVSGKIRLGGVDFNGGYGERRGGQNNISSTLRTDGATLRSSQDRRGKSKYSGRYAWLAASRDLNSRNNVELGANYYGFAGHGEGHEHNIADGSDITRDGLAHWRREGAGITLAYTHKFPTKDEKIDIEASHYTAWGRNASDYTSFVTATATPDYWQSRRSVFREGHTRFKASYVLPLPHKGKFKTGYSLRDNTNMTDNTGLWRDPTTPDWQPDPSYINLFALDRTIHSAYASVEQRYGRFGVMAGLRMEQSFLSTDLKTTGEVHDTSTLGFYPSVYLSYALTDTQEFKLSYSRRMNRPAPNLLNPARYSSDAFNVWSGNPDLKPEQVDSFETSYHDTGESYDVVVTGYYRATYNGIVSVYRYLSDTVLLTTKDNLARRMASGLEADLNASLPAHFKLRATASLSYTEFNPGAQGIGVKTSGMNWGLKGGIDWQVTPDDFLQFNARYSGKKHFAQGYRDPTMSGDLGFKHHFDGGLSAVVSLNNLFNSWNNTTVLDSPGLHQVGHRAKLGRVYFLGLVYAFGGAKDTQPITGNTDNETGAPGGH